MALTATGTAASLRWSYHTAATVRAWTVQRDDDGVWRLTATVTSSDAFRLTQRPLTFEVTHQHGRWVWPIEELQITGAALTARLGPKES